jgi:hypothetical protein
MTRKEYQKPVTDAFEAGMEAQLLSDSIVGKVLGVDTNGLGTVEDMLGLPDPQTDPISGILWGQAK